MALLIKDTKRPQGSTGRQATIDQQIQVTQATPAGAGIALPATTTGQLFRVRGGRVLVKALIGTVMTATGATATNLKVSSKRLDDANVAVGTAVDVASNVSVASLEAGAMAFVEGDGTAVVTSTAGAAFIGPNSGHWIAPQGEIYVTTSATNTGTMKWDIFYQPLDPGAIVEAAQLTAAGLLTAAI